MILTFLGKGGTGRTTVAIAAAKQLASQGRRVLLIGQDPSPTFGLLLGATVGADPQEVGANLQAVQLQSTVLLERSWEEVKQLEAQYLRSPTLKNVYGQELSIFPGLDQALAMNAIREFNNLGKYDDIVYDGNGDISTLRMLGMPESISWYQRRFQKVFQESDLGKAISPFIQPITSTILNVSWTADNLSQQQPAKQATQLIEEGKAALADPSRVAAYLVTTDAPTAIATAKYLWGSAQQISLTVGGVLLNQASTVEAIETEFAPLPLSSIPSGNGTDWQPLMDALPDFKQAIQAPKPLSIDTAARQVRLFLPGFDKKQVKLTQYGPEVTIEAGDQRRNILLPPPLSGQPVKGAKFQDGYLIISF
ncbi:MAG: ArsA family ATPase [Kastovskya adunca ATA6-11-RM4]|jgi:arsenite-transporting ATPase|nr:ArsA family ATPase [Kastovskya adunca ATA6-11-RM4]